MPKNKTKTRKKFSLFGLAATVLSLLFLILIGIGIQRASLKRNDYKNEPSVILNDLQRGRYADALSCTAENRAMGIDEKTNANYEAPYAVCDYFEACSYRTAYLKTGDDATAAFYEAKMQEAYERMGTLQFMAEDIRKALKADPEGNV